MIRDLSVRIEADGRTTFFTDGVDAPPATTRPLKVIVCGGREFADYQLLRAVLQSLNLSVVVQGAARGADRLAARAARELGVETVSCPANWDEYPRRAGIIRNREMLEHNPDAVIAFEGGRGTADMVNIADRAGIAVYRFTKVAADVSKMPSE